MREILWNATNDGIKSLSKVANCFVKAGLIIDKKICYDKIEHVENLID